jgi:hypothetical protein
VEQGENFEKRSEEGAGRTWSVHSGSVAAVHVTRFQMSRTVLALMP